MHVLEPFMPDLGLSPDHNSSDIRAEIEAHFTIQRMAEKFLKGEVDLDTFEQCLDFFGIDPIEYWQVVDQNVDHVVETQTALEHSFLILPPGTYGNSFLPE
jgi:hypothetical protein